jgi:predicted NUDIX family NTP pyrophosphohydrolase
MRRISAGLLMYRIQEGTLQVLLGHPGGPYFTHKDEGVWSIPKGELDPGEDLLKAAQREFMEEVGVNPTEPYMALSPVLQSNEKIVYAWAFRGDCDPGLISSNLFIMEWPPKSGKQMSFPEMDRAGFFDIPTARRKIVPGQVGLIDELESIIRRTKPAEFGAGQAKPSAP